MNLNAAVIQILKEADEVKQMVGERVFGTELPDDQAQDMPRPCIVVSAAGGAGSGPGARSRANWVANRLDCKCYGPTPYQSELLHNEVFRVMHKLERTVIDDIAIMDAVVAGGPLPGRDGDANSWPYTLGVYSVSAIYS